MLELDPDADATELDEATRQLQDELLALNNIEVERPSAGPVPSGAKALEWAALGKLLVSVGRDVLVPVLSKLIEWAARGSGRSFEIRTDDGKVFKATGASKEQLQQGLEAFIAELQER